MRLKLKIVANNSRRVSFNSNYAFSSAIYNLLKLSSPEFANFLHEIGYKSNHKSYKLFTFSVQYENASPQRSALLLNSPIAYLYISSPMIDDFIKNLVIGTFSQRTIEIYSEFIPTTFYIEQAELLPYPTFTETMYFVMASPMVLSTPVILNGKMRAKYLRYDSDKELINRILQQNLINKYEAITNTKYNGKGIKLEWDNNYISECKRKNKKLSKKISIMKDVSNPIDVVGILCPFTITGDPELIKVGYECGFGEKNSIGFGMVF